MNAKKLKKFKDLILEEKRKTLDELLSGNETYEALKQEAHGDMADIAFQTYEKQSLVNSSQKDKDKLDVKVSDKDIILEGLGYIKVVGYANLTMYTLNKKMISVRNKMI